MCFVIRQYHPFPKILGLRHLSMNSRHSPKKNHCLRRIRTQTPQGMLGQGRWEKQCYNLVYVLQLCRVIAYCMAKSRRATLLTGFVIFKWYLIFKILLAWLLYYLIEFVTVAENETGLMSQLISTPSLPTQPMKGCTTPPGSTPPTLYEQQCGFFYVPQESEQWKSCETGPTVFCPYPRRLECLTNCRCHIKGSTFSSVILRP